MALPTASDNVFPKVIVSEGAAPSSASAGQQKVYIDSSSHHLSRKDSSGNVVDLETNQSTALTLSTPTVVAVGTQASGTAGVTPGLPSGHQANDINMLIVQSDNETATAPAGYTQMGPVVGIGTAAAASGTRVSVFWKRDSGADSDPTVADTGDHTFAVIIGFRGCPTTGDPFLSIGQARKTTASTTGTASAGATPVDACLVVNIFAHALDTASAVFSGWTNADLSSVTEQVDISTTDGNGGGIGVATGTKAKAGSFAATTVTETTTVDVSTTLVMLPSGITARAGFIDTQVFTTAGFGDTWTKPTGAKSIEGWAIGGGASGSAGRNAATAAGGGGGGGGGWDYVSSPAAGVAATMTATPGAGGAATANSDGAAANAGNASTLATGSRSILTGNRGEAATASATGAGGAGGAGGGHESTVPSAAAFANYFGSQHAAGGTGGTTAAAGGRANDFGGGGGAGGGTSQSASAGGPAFKGAGGGGGGRSNTNVGTGGSGGGVNHTNANASDPGEDSPNPTLGGAGANGGTSAAGPGGTGGWPGGGGGGGGSQSGAQRGGAGADGVVVVITYCG